MSCVFRHHPASVWSFCVVSGFSSKLPQRRVWSLIIIAETQFRINLQAQRMMHTTTTLFMYQHVFHSNQSIEIDMLNDSFANFSIVLSAQALHHAGVTNW